MMCWVIERHPSVKRREGVVARPSVLRRSVVDLPEGSFPAIAYRGRIWLFVNGTPHPLPSSLFKVPGGVSWLLNDRFRPSRSRRLAATVIPQMGCNLGCFYCIQNERTGPTVADVKRLQNIWMSEETMAAAVAFIEEQRQARGLESVLLTIFGGEPLLNPERCYELLRRVKHLARASIVTNGVFLTPEVATTLHSLGVRSIQITFDGARADHDRVRVTAADGSGTYDTIVRNLQQMDPGVIPSRQIRVNVSKDNLANLPELLRDLARKLNPRLWKLYFALVDDNNIGWDGGLLPGQTVGSALTELARQAAQLGFRSPRAPADIGACATCSESFGQGGMVINADGLLYSCWETAGRLGMTVGNVRDGYMRSAGNERRWQQCGYLSRNQGPLLQRKGQLDEVDWALRELAVLNYGLPIRRVRGAVTTMAVAAVVVGMAIARQSKRVRVGRVR